MRKVKEFAEKYGMLTKEDKIIVGVSGGADSVCLFFMLLELQKEMGFELIAVHVNHGLRGADADADEAYVRSLCEERGILCEFFHENVELRAKNRKQSLEEAGREVRREAFFRTLEKHQGTKIALAHHQNDNAETLLMNLARGTSLSGIGGIRPVSGVMIRPILCLNRQEIEAYLMERNIPFCEDESNAELDFTRNRIRHLVLPVLEKQVNSQAVRHMNETMEQMREVKAYLDLQVEQVMKQCAETFPEGRVLQNALTEQPEVLQKMLIHRCLEELAGQGRDISQAHVQAVQELFAKQSGRALDLPYHIEGKRVYEGVKLRKCREKTEQNRSEIQLQVPGETLVPERGLRIRCRILEKPDDLPVSAIPQKAYTKWFDYGIIKQNMLLRTRQSGDRIVIDQKGSTQKLKNWFINEKIPADERDTQLLLTEGDQVLWVIGKRMSSAYQVKKETKQILEIEVTEEEKNGRVSQRVDF